MNSLVKILLLCLSVTNISSMSLRFDSQMKCSYGERGSLTATCTNATPEFFKATPYRFDHLDETLRCVNCNLEILDPGTFDLSGNQILNLDLRNSKIKQIRQRAFVGLVFLKHLDLSSNEISEIVPATFSGVKKIKSVHLNNNSISVLHSDAFVELYNLELLYLQNNRIQKIEPRAFNGLNNIFSIDLSFNQLSDVRHAFDNLTTLQVINLNDNQILSLSGDDFSNLTSLLEITLARNKIKVIPAHEFAELTTLINLDLSFNIIDSLDVGSFYGLSNLQDLDLSNNKLSQLAPKAIHGLHSLRHLNISYNSLTTFSTGMFTSGLPELRNLNLSHNSIERVEITGVFSLHSLHTLDLSYNKISDFDFKAFIRRLPRISLLNLYGNDWPCYLEEDMNKYFAEDNFKFILYDSDTNTSHCKNTDRPTDQDKSVIVAEELYDNVRETPTFSRAAIIWSFTLISILLVLMGLLFYSQYRVIRELRQNSVHRAVSQVQLISSELESRDNDYMKE